MIANVRGGLLGAPEQLGAQWILSCSNQVPLFMVPPCAQRTSTCALLARSLDLGWLCLSLLPGKASYFPPPGINAVLLPRWLSVMGCIMAASTSHGQNQQKTGFASPLWQSMSRVFSVLFSPCLHKVWLTFPISPELTFFLRIFKPSQLPVVWYTGFPVRANTVLWTQLPLRVSPFLKIIG